MPGANSGQAPPMSAHGGMIGMPQALPQDHAPQYYAPQQQVQQYHVPQQLQHHHPHSMQHAAAHGQPMYHGMHAGASGGGPAMPSAQAAPQAWAFPTPHGMQLVQPGMTVSHVAPMVAGTGMPGTRRIRWETIVPAAAIACLLAALALFISDFDRITGRDGAASAATGSTQEASAADSGDTDAAASSSGDAAEIVAQAKALYAQGRFEDAANLLHPILDVEQPDAAAVALHDQVDAAKVRNDQLLARLARERAAGNWAAVNVTIGQLARLRPLSKSLVELRATARQAVGRAGAIARAKALMAQGRDTAAMAVIDREIAKGSTAQLEAMREQISAKRAAPSTGGGGAGAQAPPSSGGRSTSQPAVRPPANVPAAAMPPRPDLPNPTGGTGSGAAAVGGGAAAAGGSNCHTHDGVVSCHP
jgi:hypothetical protein